ncbi:hypothetical protein AB0942_27685 [Streptomyces nodosus]|uniref:hypothetical protein n=1 Tax=Streptomyces nodosus TaxID=40318 RepID=UPI003453A6E0
MNLSNDGQRLAPQWAEIGNNICGTLHACRDASALAERFVRVGWSSRSSSWHAYEVETSWCQMEIEPIEGADVLLNGIVDPSRVDELAELLDRWGLKYSLELYDKDGFMVREIPT